MSLFDGRKKDLRDEIESHLRMATADRVAAGATPEDARRDAMREFGNVPLVADVTRERWGWGWLESLVQDVRFALRQLWKTPGFTVTAILTLALGIGANAAIFTLVNAVLMKDLPVSDPKTLIRIGDNNDCCNNSGGNDDGDYALFSTDTYQQFTKNAKEFEDLAAMQAGFDDFPLTIRRNGGDGMTHSSIGEFVSGNYFRTFGLKPQMGRMLSDTDDAAGAPMVAVMSYETWKNHYAGDISVIGSTFWINTKPVTLIGIAPEGFYGDRLSSAPPEFYLPLSAIEPIENTPFAHDPDVNWLYFIGRIKPGVALGPLQQKLSTQLRQIYTPSKIFSLARDKPLLAKTHVVLTPGGAGIQGMQENYASNLKLLLWISGLVLLIACANIANLLLVRGMARKTEISVRAALGARQGRIVRQLLTESAVLAIMSGIAALAVSYLGARMLLALAFPGAEDVPIHASPSWEVLGFALGVSLLTAVLFGVAPAWIAAKAEPADALRAGTRATAGGASLLQRGLVVLQAALSLVLLVGAGLFARSLGNLKNIDLKLDTHNRYIVHINPQAAGYSTTQVAALYRAMEERFHAIPGVLKVGISSYSPMENKNWGNSVQIQGQPDLNSDASFVKVNPEYFDSVGTHIVMGRGMGVQDTTSAPAVAVVNQSFVKKYFKADENPIGQHFGDPGPPPSTGDFEIVGVVEDTAYASARWKDHRMYFLPITQRPASAKDPIETDRKFFAATMVIETARPMDDMEALTRKTLANINPNLTVIKFQTFEAQVGNMFRHERMLSTLMSLFGGLALLLATVGLYGVTSYSVARRTSEIGIRMALGAERGGVVAMVMRSALSQTVIGLAIGIPVAYYGVVLVKSQLYELTTVSVGASARWRWRWGRCWRQLVWRG